MIFFIFSHLILPVPRQAGADPSGVRPLLSVRPQNISNVSLYQRFSGKAMLFRRCRRCLRYAVCRRGAAIYPQKGAAIPKKEHTAEFLISRCAHSFLLSLELSALNSVRTTFSSPFSVFRSSRLFPFVSLFRREACLSPFSLSGLPALSYLLASLYTRSGKKELMKKESFFNFFRSRFPSAFTARNTPPHTKKNIS